MSYDEAYGRWVNSFTATWPSLLREPESELVKVEETKFKTAIGLAQIFLPEVAPTNKIIVMQWLADIVNSSKHLFPSTLTLDWDALENYTPPELPALQEPSPGRPESAADAVSGEIDGRITKIEQFLHRNGRALNLISRNERP